MIIKQRFWVFTIVVPVFVGLTPTLLVELKFTRVNYGSEKEDPVGWQEKSAIFVLKKY